MSSADPRPGTTPPSGPGPDPTHGVHDSRDVPDTNGSHAVRASDVRTSGSADPQFPEPQGPRTTGVGGHLLGIIVGLVLAAVALVVTALGMSRILAANGVGEQAVVLDGLGIVLVTLGALLTALVALLGVRTSTIPFTGGLVALAVGAAYLFAPGAAHRETVRLLATQQNSDAVLNTLTVLVLGVPFVLGLVLVATGFVASLVRRRGIAVGSFRERTRGSRSSG